jgi:mannosyl-oligosaccharide alpha-1,2-mannosidase
MGLSGTLYRLRWKIFTFLTLCYALAITLYVLPVTQFGALNQDGVASDWQPKKPDLVEDGIDRPPRRPAVPADPARDRVIAERRRAVKGAMEHAWGNYVEHAWGSDELRPISKSGHNWMGNGQGASIVDSLDTLYLMGMKDEFKRARDWVASFQFVMGGQVSTFENTIRILGGLLAAYDLSLDPIFLEKAKEVGDGLAKAFQGHWPYTSIDMRSGSGNWGWSGKALLSEVATIQLEFITLSKRSGNPVYAQKVTKYIEQLDGMKKPNDALYPLYLDPHSSSFAEYDSKRISLGAMGDSFYEYLIKTWLLVDKKQSMFYRMYVDSAEAIRHHLIQKSAPGGLTYIAERRGSRNDPKMDHLACFAGGMYALGSKHLRNEHGDLKEKHLELGEEITKTCYEVYHRMPTGIFPEVIRFDDSSKDFSTNSDRHYILRPETVESLFILYRVTGDSKYQEWGWEIFNSIVKSCKVAHGFSGIRDVTRVPPEHDDYQQSFFLAETLKYLYLLFAPELIDIDEWVFNTEAHPLRIHPSDTPYHIPY